MNDVWDLNCQPAVEFAAPTLDLAKSLLDSELPQVSGSWIDHWQTSRMFYEWMHTRAFESPGQGMESVRGIAFITPVYESIPE